MSSPSAERRRVREHLTRALRSVRSAPTDALTAPQRARRRAALRALARYIAEGHYPLNRVSPSPTPVFVDEAGARCAMAALIEFTGDGELVRRVARDHNLAYVEQLRGDPTLLAWLDHNGITLAEAARILTESPGAMELRRLEALQTLTGSGVSKVIFDLARPAEVHPAAMAAAMMDDRTNVRVEPTLNAEGRPQTSREEMTAQSESMRRGGR